MSAGIFKESARAPKEKFAVLAVLSLKMPAFVEFALVLLFLFIYPKGGRRKCTLLLNSRRFCHACETQKIVRGCSPQHNINNDPGAQQRPQPPTPPLIAIGRCRAAMSLLRCSADAGLCWTFWTRGCRCWSVCHFLLRW